MRQLRVKSRVIGWIILILIIMCGWLFSCTPEEIKPELNGIYSTDGIELFFNNGELTGQTDCNTLTGDYFTSENYIDINLKSTKVYCINEYKTVYFRDVFKYKIEGKNLILSGNDFNIMLYNIN